ncbi:MAG: class I SAM-dependent methyltransferase [Treponema sp.]|nr:class I SAM-dependent methyltransferase [Treponema sp.]
MDKTTYQAELLQNRLVKRCRHLRRWAVRTGIEAYRIYDRDIPEIPLVLDLYGYAGGNAVSGALYKRPYEKDEQTESLWLGAMRGAISKALEIAEDRIFLKMRQKQKGNSQYSRMDSSHFQKNIKEGGLIFKVNLSDYLDTGLFLDSRKKRNLIRSQAAGKRVLNLFSYTCTLSVCAAAGNAAAVDSVDISNTYLEWGLENFRLNNINSVLNDEKDFWRQQHDNNLNDLSHNKLIRADALQFIGRAAAKSYVWDLIILDPPSFSNSKKMNDDLDIRRDYRELIDQCLAILSPQGNLWFSTNARGFKFETDEFSDYQIQKIDLTDEDFIGKKIPQCWIISA